MNTCVMRYFHAVLPLCTANETKAPILAEIGLKPDDCV